MALFIKIQDMPVVTKVLRQAEEKIRELTGKNVTVFINTSVDAPLNKRFLLKEKVKELVANDFEVPWEDIAGKCRKFYLVEARHVYMYLMNQIVGISTVETGNDLFRDHTTVIHAVTKIRGYYKMSDQQHLINRIEFLKLQIEAEIQTIKKDAA